MGNRHDDRSSRMGTRNDPRQGRVGPPRQGGARAHERGAPERAFDRNADMGGSGWSGASGRGGINREREPEQQQYSAQENRGYAPEDSYMDTDAPDYGSGYDHEGGYGHVGGYAGSRGYSHDRGRYTDEGGFVSERGFGHVPGQGWHGGYGGDRDRSGYDSHPDRGAIGRGFTGNDFSDGRDYPPRRFGNEVDRGGRMGPSDYGYQGTDMGMGAPDEDRGPHYGKGPKGYKRSDERTREDVCDAIAHQGRIDATDVEVTVESGIVTLSGTVAQRQEKRALEHLVERCRGVHEVHNELRLKRLEAKDDKGPPSTKAPQAATPRSTHGDGDHKNGKGARA